MVLPNAEKICKVIEKEHPEEFSRLIQSKRALSLFMADWCSPCRLLMQDLTSNDSFKDFLDQNQIQGIYVDVDRSQVLVDEYRIRAVPQIMFFGDGKYMDNNIGVIGRSQLTERIKRNYNLDKVVAA